MGMMAAHIGAILLIKMLLFSVNCTHARHLPSISLLLFTVSFSVATHLPKEQPELPPSLCV